MGPREPLSPRRHNREDEVHPRRTREDDLDPRKREDDVDPFLLQKTREAQKKLAELDFQKLMAPKQRPSPDFGDQQGRQSSERSHRSAKYDDDDDDRRDSGAERRSESREPFGGSMDHRGGSRHASREPLPATSGTGNCAFGVGVLRLFSNSR